ncbi:MAG: hypothetical protein ACQES4_05995 [Bacillota bacterium]
MIGTKCPGQDMRYWTADDVYEEDCPKCGEPVEFFKTDIRLRCPNCKAKMANPRFDMGCAQYCAYAEQCLGPGAKGMQSKSIRAILEGEAEKLVINNPEKVESLKQLINRAEKECEEKKIDMLPVIASLIIIFLRKENLIDTEFDFIDRINKEHNLPQVAVKDVKSIISSLESYSKEHPGETIKPPAFELVKKLASYLTVESAEDN